MPDHPAAFEDSQGNPDWAAAGRGVSSSQVSESLIDRNDDIGSSDAAILLADAARPSQRSLQARAWIVQLLSGLTALSVAGALIEFGVPSQSQTLWFLVGLLAGGVISVVLQLRNSAGLATGAAAIFGANGAKVTLLAVMAGTGATLGTLLDFRAFGTQLLIPLLVASTLAVMGILSSTGWLLRMLISIGGIGYLVYSFAQQGVTLALSQFQFQLGSQPEYPDLAVGLALSMTIHLMIPVSVLTRLFVAVAMPISAAAIQLSTDAVPATVFVVISLASGLLLVHFVAQPVEMTSSRPKAVTFQIATLLAFGIGVFASTASGSLTVAFGLLLVCWTILQLPAALTRRASLHRKSLGLGYGFYQSIQWLGLVGFLIGAIGIAVGVWLSLSLPWLLAATSLLSFLVGCGLIPSFRSCQSEHLAAEKRKNEPVRVSSEDLQWSE